MTQASLFEFVLTREGERVFRNLDEDSSAYLSIACRWTNSLVKNYFDRIIKKYSQVLFAGNFISTIQKKSLKNLGASFKKLKEKIRSYQGLQVPIEIKEIIEEKKILTPEQVKKLKEFIQARDVLVVWEKLCFEIRVEEDFSQAYDSHDSVVNKAKGFSSWVEKNQFSGLYNLEVLDLSNKQLTEIPKEISLFCNLEVLCLRDNQLTQIPKELGNLVFLYHLDLHGNQLKSVPEELGQIGCVQIQDSFNKKRLDLSSNQLTEIPQELGNIENLRELFLGDNQLSEIPETLGNLCYLENLSLFKNRLTKIPKKLGDLESLIGLNVNNNRLTLVPKELGRLSELKWLYLKDNKLEKIPEELFQLHQKKLEELDLSGNPIE